MYEVGDIAYWRDLKTEHDEKLLQLLNYKFGIKNF